MPVVRVHAMHKAGEGDEPRGPGRVLVNFDRESSVFMTGLCLRPRGSCAVYTSAAAFSVVRGSIAATEKGVRRRTSAGEAANK